MIPAYPLTWPSGWPRTPNADRIEAKFRGGRSAYSSHAKLSTFDATTRVLGELARLGADGDGAIIISTDVPLRADGLPRSGTEPADPGAAIYWILDGVGQCMAIDRYDRLADNIAAIAASIEALRAIERHGGAQIVRRAFAGFKALPSTTTNGVDLTAAWQIVERFAGVRISDTNGVRREMAQIYIRRARGATHPDNPTTGNATDFLAVQAAADRLGEYYGVKL